MGTRKCIANTIMKTETLKMIMSRRYSNQTGSVLVVALWILAIFVMLVLSLGFRSNVEAKFSLRHQEYFAARHTLYSAMNLAHYYIQNDDDPSVDSPQDEWYNQITISEDIWPQQNIVLHKRYLMKSS